MHHEEPVVDTMETADTEPASGKKIRVPADHVASEDPTEIHKTRREKMGPYTELDEEAKAKIDRGLIKRMVMELSGDNIGNPEKLEFRKTDKPKEIAAMIAGVNARLDRIVPRPSQK